MKKLPFYLLTLFTLILVSCGKEKSGASSSQIDGTYNFKGIQAKTVSEVTAIGEDEKLVTTSDYTSINNSGTITFRNGKMTSKDMAYSIDTDMQIDSYVDGVLDDSYTYPFQFAIPPTSSSGTYKMIGKDSIYFPQSTFMIGTDPNTMQSNSGGGKFTINGNLLTIVVKANKDSVFTESGYTYHQVSSIEGKIFLEK